MSHDGNSALRRQGAAHREAAAALGVRVRTINSHVANIRRKLGVASRTAAVVEAFRRGLA